MASTRWTVAILSLVVLANAVGCARQTYRAGAPEGMIDVIAHRGASAYAPENTLAAFELAIEQGADWFELDTHMSADYEIICIHDATVDRTTDGTGAVRDMTIEELKALDAGSWKDEAYAGERLPTLGEALDLAKGRIGVYVELKPIDDDGPLETHLMSIASDRTQLLPHHASRVLSLIEASGSHNYEMTVRAIQKIRERNMQDQVVIQSFSPIICATVRAMAPNIPAEYLGAYDPEQPGAWLVFLRWTELIGPHGVNLNYTHMTQEQLQMFQNRGQSVAVWTVNDPDAMRRMAEWGVDGIITDYPDICIDVLREMGRR